MEDEETIVTDVSEVETEVETEVEQAPDPRAMAMAAILADRASNRDVDEDEPGEEEEIPVEPEPPEDEQIVLKVNDKDMRVPKGDVIAAGIRTLQKETSADERLRQAAQIEAKLREREESLHQMEERLLAKSQPDTGSQAHSARSSPRLCSRTTIRSRRLCPGLPANSMTWTGGYRRVQKDREREAATRQEKIVKHYHTAYRDIASDPTMHFDFNLRTGEISAEEPDLSEIEGDRQGGKSGLCEVLPQVRKKKPPRNR